MYNSDVTLSTTEPVLLYREFVIKDRGEVRACAREASAPFGARGEGHPIIVMHWGAVLDGHVIEVGHAVPGRFEDDQCQFLIHLPPGTVGDLDDGGAREGSA